MTSVVKIRGVLFGKQIDKQDVFQFGQEDRKAFQKMSLARVFFSSTVEKSGANSRKPYFFTLVERKARFLKNVFDEDVYDFGDQDQRGTLWETD